MQCIVHGCTNDKTEGYFKGDICMPCYRMIKTGKVGPTNSFIGGMKQTIDELSIALEETNAVLSEIYTALSTQLGENKNEG